MKNLLFLLLVIGFCPSVFGQCITDTVIGGTHISYSYKADDSSVNLKVQFNGKEYGNEKFYYDSNECSFIPKIVSKIDDSTLIFRHGKGQTYRVITIVTDRDRHVKVEKFENELFYKDDNGNEKLFFMIDKRPFLIESNGDSFHFKKYKKRISVNSLNLSANLYAHQVKLVNKKGASQILKYSDFK